ncbi:MAG TPA: hypothetical protein VMP11_21500 [Verrucomicrobiae bacterium]|nr:hypothetical protein [Verrucomicrobiae bacterium]
MAALVSVKLVVAPTVLVTVKMSVKPLVAKLPRASPARGEVRSAYV